MKTKMREAVFDSFFITMTLEQANAASHSGQCADDVAALLEDPKIKAQLDAIGPEKIREELEHWSDWDISQDVENRHRIIWLAAGNIVEEEF